MALKRLRVTYADDNAKEVVVVAAARVATERHFGLSIDKLTSDEHGFYLAWMALQKSGQEARDFEAFLDVVVDIEPMKSGDKESADPTGDPDQPPDTSSS